MKIAVMGCGTVGKSVVKMLDAAGDIKVKYILELPEKCTEERMVSDPESFFGDPEIETVVDVLPAVHPSYELMKKALEAGKNVVTSNKAALAFGYDELMGLAEKNGLSLRFEATCGGTIPVIEEAMKLSATNEVTACFGIMNGTTNFILDSMIRGGVDFEPALCEAKRLGYAEADPTADLSGYDVKNKIIILSNTAYHASVTDSFPVSGIEKITKDVLDSLAGSGQTVKLLGMSVRENDRYAIGVVPVILPAGSLEAGVPRNFNMFTLRCSYAGDVKLYGQGAGGDPTADAVVRDLVEIAGKTVGSKKSTEKKTLVYDPDLLTGTGMIGDKCFTGSLASLYEKAKEFDEFFAFRPDFL